MIPAKLESIKFREKEMSILLENLIDDQDRIIELLGLKGIGKSSMARNTLHYAAERKMFTNGILHTQLKEVRSTFVMLKQIMRHILR